MRPFVQKMGPMEEDQAFAIACDWKEVASFLAGPAAWIAKVSKKLSPQEALVLAPPPPPRSLSFLCQYTDKETAKPIKDAAVIEGTRLSDVVHVRVVPDGGGPHVDRLSQSLTPTDSKLQVTLRPTDGLGYAHLSLKPDTRSDLVMAALRNPNGFVSFLNTLLDSKQVVVEPGTEEGGHKGRKPTVTFEALNKRMLKDVLFVYQLELPNKTPTCLKVTVALKRSARGYRYKLRVTSWMLTLYFSAGLSGAGPGNAG